MSIAALLPEYEIQRELGRGAMGLVYLGTHRKLGRKVAIKELAPNLADDPEVRSRFLTEARTLAALQHPNIVPVYDYIEQQGRCVLIMEALAGGTVWTLFTRDGLSFAKSCELTLTTCAAVQHAHEHGVLHRDIKPENLLLTESGELKVADFGIAKVINGGRTLATIDGSVLGTPAYMAPEQAEGATVGPPADVYAIGTMLYEFVSGRLPFDGDAPMSLLVQRITGEPRNLLDVAPTVPADLASVIMRSLERDPSARYPTAKALGDAVATAGGTAFGSAWLAAVTRSTPSSGTTRAPSTIAPTATSPDPQLNAPPTVAPLSRRPVDTADTSPATLDTSPATPDITPDITRDVSGTATVTRRDETTHATTGTMVRPVGPQHAAGFDARALNRSELVGIESLIGPTAPLSRPVAALLAALAAALVLVVVGPSMKSLSVDAGLERLRLNGQTLSVDAAQSVDLSRPLTLSGIAVPGTASVRARLTLLGVPVGSFTAPLRGSSATVDLGKLGWGVHGPAVLTIQATDNSGLALAQRDVAIKDANKPWRTAQTPVAIVLLAGAFSAAEARSRQHRKGRVRNSAVVAAAAAGALLGVCSLLLWATYVGRPVAITVTVATALTSAIAAGALTVVRARRARRRRLRWKADR